ncbi:MAG TPA: DNA ligase D [Dongiaceae bacterium]|nr:DNA ligase D [Dongiaceae bacterium]
MSKSLDVYRAKRDFSKTPEPAGKQPATESGNAYVIQKHAARRMHYDFRLELNGVLKSWAVPEGPSLIPNKKRLAVHVEDHPLEYGDFEGVIPEGEYGAGTVMVWDKGTWSPEFDPEFGYRKGHLKFRLNGKKLKGIWHLVRMAPKPREKQEAWLLFKSEDEAARSVDAPDILQEMPASAATGRDIAEIAADHDRVWSSRQGGEVAVAGKKARKRSKPAVDPSAMPKAKPEKLPKFIEPMLPSAVEKAPSSADWVHEVKYDGYRVQVRIENGKARLLTRKGLDWTERFTGVADAVVQLPVKSALIDAEVVVQTETGVASFTALVDALTTGSGTLILYAFDLLHLDGYDVRAAPLKDRKAALAKIIAAHGDTSRIRYSDHIEGEGDAVFRAAGRLGLEGIVSKRISTPYQSGRTNNWVKIKATERGEFVIAGFVISTASKRAIGALVLGEHVGGKLTPSGHVGSGFSASDASALWQRLDPMRTSTAPLKDETAVAKGAKWVEPKLVAEIEFRGRTGSGVIRHATFREIVEGADPAKVVRNRSAAAKAPAEAMPPVKLTNPGRLEWPDQGITKQGLADFYTEIADWILPHIADRPLSLVRCPGGVQEQCFFQKHKWAGLGDAVRLVKVPGEKEPMLALDSLAGLLELVQASVLEIHPWGAKADDPERPDRVTLDLDPGDNVPWQQVIDAALEARTRLADLGLQSFVKTTGGKGLHVVFPLTPKADWDAVKRFAQSIAEQMAADAPRRYTANMAKKVRDGRIFVDYLRNGMGATAVAAYSTRARPGAAVSTPLAWDELGPGIRSNHFTVENLPKRLPFLDRDPWEGLSLLRQELPGARTSARTTPSKTREPKSAPLGDSIQQLLPDAVAPSKDALRAYWKKTAKDALAYLGRRPLRLVRHAGGKIFYHQGRFPHVPDAVHQLPIEKREGGESVRLWVDNLEGLLGLVEIDVVELHPWGSTVDDIERPDGLVFVLEPGDELDWRFVTDSALQLRAVLKAEDLDSWPKLTGTGVHVMAPIEPDLDWDEAHAYSRSIAERLAAAAPDRYVTTAAKANRQGRLFLNWLSNSRGLTAVGAYSPRALPGFPVVAPVTWRELERGIRPDTFTMQKPPKPRSKT